MPARSGSYKNKSGIELTLNFVFFERKFGWPSPSRSHFHANRLTCWLYVSLPYRACLYRWKTKKNLMWLVGQCKVCVHLAPIYNVWMAAVDLSPPGPIWLWDLRSLPTSHFCRTSQVKMHLECRASESRTYGWCSKVDELGFRDKGPRNEPNKTVKREKQKSNSADSEVIDIWLLFNRKWLYGSRKFWLLSRSDELAPACNLDQLNLDLDSRQWCGDLNFLCFAQCSTP